MERPYKWATTEWLRQEYEKVRKESSIKTTWHRRRRWFGGETVTPGSVVWQNDLFAEAMKMHFELTHRVMHGEPKRPKGWKNLRIKVGPRFLMPPGC